MARDRFRSFLRMSQGWPLMRSPRTFKFSFSKAVEVPGIHKYFLVLKLLLIQLLCQFKRLIACHLENCQDPLPLSLGFCCTGYHSNLPNPVFAITLKLLAGEMKVVDKNLQSHHYCLLSKILFDLFLETEAVLK